MRKIALIGAMVVGAAVLSASPISVNWSSTQKSVDAVEDGASAAVGKPLAREVSLVYTADKSDAATPLPRPLLSERQGRKALRYLHWHYRASVLACRPRQHPDGRRRMIRLIAVAGFALAVATSAQAMPRAPLSQPDGVITQARMGCGAGRVMVNGVCQSRAGMRQERRATRRCARYSGGVCVH